MRTLIVIPARLGSWRFPDKPLTLIEGKPMIEHVYRRCLLVKGVDEVVLAICEDKVKAACESFGAKYVMTSDKPQTALDRVAEAAQMLNYVQADDIVLNVQGDEPAVPPIMIEMTIEKLLSDKVCQCSNLVEEIKEPEDLKNHHRTKAVISQGGRLIYITRQAIPATVFDIKKRAVFYQQTGIMAFRGAFLQKFTQLPRTPLELIEGIDMLRLIEHDYPIATAVCPYSTQPVDTPEDIAKVIQRLKNDKWFKNGYKK